MTLRQFYETGFDVVVPKPFTREALGRAIIEGCARRSTERRRRQFDLVPVVPWRSEDGATTERGGADGGQRRAC
jgi:hypothetical protein